MQTKIIENKIYEQAQGIKATLDMAYQERQDTLDKILNLKNEQANIYQKIAVIYLKESPENGDFQVQNIIKQLQGLYSDLNSKLSKLEKQTNQYQQQLTNTLAKLDELTTQKVLQLESDPDYVSSFNRFIIEQESLEKVNNDYEICQKEFSKKLAEYSKNSYYNYLIKRNYGEDNYKGRWVFRNLDESLAEFVHFNENYKNQKILESLMKESQLKYDNQKKLYDFALKQKNNKEQLVENSLKLPQLKTELAKIEHDLDKAECQKQEAYNTLNDTQSGQSVQFKKLSSKLAKLLENQSIKKLEQLTLQTKSKEDDILLKKIPELDKQIKKLEQRIPHFQQSIGNLEDIFIRFNQTLNLFRQNNIPSSFYEYKISSNTLNNLLNNLIEYSDSPEKIVMELLARRVLRNNTTSSSTNSGWSILSSSSSSSSKRSSRSSSSWSSSSSRTSSSSSSSSSSGNGYSSSSSSGGGGYRTTDSF